MSRRAKPLIAHLPTSLVSSTRNCEGDLLPIIVLAVDSDCLDQEVVLFCSPGPADDFFRHGIWSRGDDENTERVDGTKESGGVSAAQRLFTSSCRIDSNSHDCSSATGHCLSTRHVSRSRIFFWRGGGPGVAHNRCLWARFTPCHKKTTRGGTRADVGCSTLCPTRTLRSAQRLEPTFTLGYSKAS